MDRNWTKRGTITNEDKVLIKAIAKENPAASRIFITGELHEDQLGDIATPFLYASNDAVPDPLFVQTKDLTVQMARFDPKEVWQCLSSKEFGELLNKEEDRLGLARNCVIMDEYDFYASMIASLQKEHGRVSVPITEKKDLTSFYNVMYFGCLWLYEKPGYMAVPVSRHFALKETVLFMKHDFLFRVLTPKELGELTKVREQYKNVEGITNTELNTLMKFIKAEGNEG